METNPLTRGSWARSGTTLALLSLAVGQAAALGLGRIAAQSSLGEPLRAEIEVTSLSSDEAAGLQVRIAGPEAYRAAGVDYNPVLSSARAALQRRPDGRTVLRLVSERVVQEPFVELILDLVWPSGHLVREYTVLIDPPNQTAQSTPATSDTQSGSAMTSPGVAQRSPALPPVPQVATMPSRRVMPQAAPPRSIDTDRADSRSSPPARSPDGDFAPARGSSGVERYQVRPGDTLAGIAERTRQPGVSLDQMLASLYRDNTGAFIGNNIDRLRSGAVLQIPNAAGARGISPEQARQTIQARSADFGAYRRGLAGAVAEARTESPSRRADGAVQAAVDDRKRSAATSLDRLTLGKDASTIAAVTDALASLQRERRDAETRLATVMRSIEELKALAGQAGAGAPPAGSQPASSPAAAALSGPDSTAPAASGAALPGARVLPPPTFESPASAAASSASTRPAAAAASAAAERRAKAVAAAEPAPSGGILAWLLDDNSFALPLGALLLTLLLVAGVLRFRRRSGAIHAETSFLDSGSKADSFYGASGGQHVDTRQPAGGSMSSGYSLSQLDAGGDVDPVAEADVYLAYGRDLQAEEILKDAMRSDPERLAIRTKLLEVYAKRRDTKGFEVLAAQLHALTGGRGADWETAQQLGRTIEAENPFYQPGGAPQRNDDEDDGPREPLDVHTLPGAILRPADGQPAGRVDVAGPVDIDIDFGFDDPAPDGSGSLPPLSFDEPPATGEATEMLPVEIEDLPAAPPVVAATLSGDAGPLEFDLLDLKFDDAPAPRPATASPLPAATPATPTSSLDVPMEFDLSSISFDLDTAPEAAPAPVAAQVFDADAIDLFSGAETGSPLQRKLTLAEEFLELGDSDGARDLLLEVVADAGGDSAAMSKAEALLARVR